MGRKKHFSLIEISVAMAVASIGVAAIMALLPLAVKSSSDSVGDTLATDAANTVIARIDEMIAEDFNVVFSFTKYPSNYEQFHTSKANTYYKEFTGTKKLPAGSSYIFETAQGEDTDEVGTSTVNGHFHFFFGPEGKDSDFSADVWCWRDDSFKVTQLVSGTKLSQLKKKDLTDADTNQIQFIRVYIEISWPLSRPFYIKKTASGDAAFPRQTRLFVREYFNPRYAGNQKKD